MPVAVVVELGNLCLHLILVRRRLGLRRRYRLRRYLAAALLPAAGGRCFRLTRLRHATPFPGRSLPMDTPTETCGWGYAAAFCKSSSILPGFAISKALSSASLMLLIAASCCSTV